jgi:hypothetical protein
VRTETTVDRPRALVAAATPRADPQDLAEPELLLEAGAADQPDQ